MRGETHYRNVGSPALGDDGGGGGEGPLELPEDNGQVCPDRGLSGVDGEDAVLQPLELGRLFHKKRWRWRGDGAGGGGSLGSRIVYGRRES